jgi:hypothetical protein
MKKLAIGSILGAIVIFFWQFLSFALLNLHNPATDYTPKQTEVLNYLNSQFTESGSYYMPRTANDASSEEMEKAMADAQGKPWAIVSYHKSMNMSMGSNMVRGIVVNIIMVALLCGIVSKLRDPTFGNILLTSIAIGMIVFFNVPYTSHIWYETFDLSAYLIDAIVGWGLVGVVVGLVYRRRA